MYLTECIDEFLIEQRVRGNSAATVDYYSRTLRFFRDFIGEVEIADVTLSDCRQYYLSLVEEDITTVSVQTYIRGLRAFLNWCYESEYTDVDICAKFKLPKATRKVIDVLTDREVSSLLNSLSGDDWLAARNRLIVALMIDSGLRLHEVVTLTRNCVHVDEGYLVVQCGKGDKQRIVPFGSSTAKFIREYTRLVNFPPGLESLLIKVSDIRYGYEPISDVTIKQLFRKLKERSGIRRLKPHLLRHTFATRYLENGGNIYTLQAVLGHTSLEMVKRYLHLATSRIRSDFYKFSPLDNLK